MIGFILGSTGALLIGLVIGHSWGEKSGYKKRDCSRPYTIASKHLLYRDPCRNGVYPC